MPEAATRPPSVLSIQSHVVHGYVGNKCAVLPLNLLGFEVDPINSVQFSNHTGYPTKSGTVGTGKDLWDLVTGLQENQLLNYTHLLTGYIGSETLLETIAKTIKAIREVNPDATYVCDPVMGDSALGEDGRMYVSKGLLGVYRDLIIPLATVITPNQYEAELLSGRTIKTQKDAVEVCRDLRQRGPTTVVITSLHLESDPNTLIILATTSHEQETGSSQELRLVLPRKKAYFTGTGDLLSALLLAWLHKHPSNLKLAVELAIAGLQAVLGRTIAAAGDAVTATELSSEVMRARELRLVESLHLLPKPDVQYHAEPADG
ncbi:hypothetical protein WJX74_001552 [Apatococcus lobatus]|uniref:pyridoxal kinase n=1 Tax=Apatococcus lobatus TaxID=904363 RepID=A0AAW1QXW3_9CHLO